MSRKKGCVCGTSGACERAGAQHGVAWRRSRGAEGRCCEAWRRVPRGACRSGVAEWRVTLVVRGVRWRGGSVSTWGGGGGWGGTWFAGRVELVRVGSGRTGAVWGCGCGGGAARAAGGMARAATPGCGHSVEA